MLAILSHGSGPRRHFVPLLALLINLYHLGAGAVATIQRKPYPWRVFRWTFPVAALAFYAPSLIQIARHPAILIDPYALLLYAANLLPGALQVTLLWWPASTSPSPPSVELVEPGE
jgi:hypothetical protein